MELRKLKLDDAKYMLEWMHDPNVVQWLQTKFINKSLEDCQNFISNSWNDKTNLHLAITNDKDEYLGTVSLKNIDINKGCAEFAITVRKSAMGTGCAAEGMRKIIRKGFEEFGLKNIYWCVARENKRAISFYLKNGYKEVATPKIEEITQYTVAEIEKYLWFQITNDSKQIS